MVALENWVTKGIAPPASRVPSIAAGTAVVLCGGENAKCEGLRDPARPATASMRRSTGSIRRAARRGRLTQHELYGTPRFGSGCRRQRGRGHPAAANRGAARDLYRLERLQEAQPSELCDRDGSYIAFAKTKAEREAAGDPRLSIEERYGSRADYVAKVKAAADALVAERLLLPADAAAYVQAAETSDRF